MKNLKSLPEKWVILMSEQIYNIVLPFFQEKLGRTPKDTYKNSYWHYPEYLHEEENVIFCTASDIKGNYQEITIEQFKEWVLKEKDYKILEFKHSTLDYFVEFKPNGKYLNKNSNYTGKEGVTLEAMLEYDKNHRRLISSVSNNDGNIFKIFDTVKSDGNILQVITGFRLSKDNKNVFAITDIYSHYGVNINKLEHYIKPEKNINITSMSTGIGKTIIDSKEETLIEKANRLYKEGIKYIPSSMYGWTYPSQISNGRIRYNFDKDKVYIQGQPGFIYTDGKWAEIINNNFNSFKIGDNFRLKYWKSIHTIKDLKIINNSKVIYYESGGNLHTVLLHNIEKI